MFFSVPCILSWLGMAFSPKYAQLILYFFYSKLYFSLGILISSRVISGVCSSVNTSNCSLLVAQVQYGAVTICRHPKMEGSRPPLPLLVSQSQKLSYTHSPLVRKNQKPAYPSPPVVRNKILMYYFFLKKYANENYMGQAQMITDPPPTSFNTLS